MNKKTGNIPGVILAAGEGKRIGKNKALIKIDGTSFLELVTDSLRDGGCDSIIVVGGASSDEVKKLSEKLGVIFVLNENWQKGQFSSLKTGLSSINEKQSRLMITLVDHPFVNQNTYHRLIKESFDNPDHIIIPIYEARRGHPIIIPKLIIDEVISAPDDSILRDIIFNHKELIHELVVEDPGILRDIDVKEDIIKMSE
ncbi:MAG: nucleotidyltransferase family protein [candidate division Zixibacteria bacterium]|nr:nucleotidyltransferase family protein [candidate division Zixibacteria bacterium]